MLRDIWRARRSLGSHGAAAVEMALVTPMLLTLSLGGVDYGNLFNGSQALVAATRVGAETARNDPFCQSGGIMPSSTNSSVLAVQSACQNAIENNMKSSGNFNPALTFPSTFALTCYCDGDGGLCDPSLTAPYQAPANYSCSTPTTTYPNGRGYNELFITISASQSTNPLISWPSVAFPSTISGVTEIRLQ